jgi:hypothetical protein
MLASTMHISTNNQPHPPAHATHHHHNPRGDQTPQATPHRGATVEAAASSAHHDAPGPRKPRHRRSFPQDPTGCPHQNNTATILFVHNLDQNIV